jgi:electron transfer flavoprotein beta subunit
MKFLVSIKMVPDVYAPFQIKEGELLMDGDRMVLNAYDASAVEEALVLTEKYGGDVEVVCVGPTKASETIRKALAMGAAKGHHIHIAGDEHFDSTSYAHILATFCKDKDFDVFSFGKQSQDMDSGLTGGMVAQLLEIPFATNAVGLEIENEHLIVKRQGDTGQEMIELSTPCLVTCSNDMNEPRIPNLKGIMASKRKPIESLNLSDLSLDSDTLIPATKITSYEPVPSRKAGQKFEGEPEEIAVQVAQLLDTEANVF